MLLGGPEAANRGIRRRGLGGGVVVVRVKNLDLHRAVDSAKGNNSFEGAVGLGGCGLTNSKTSLIVYTSLGAAEVDAVGGSGILAGSKTTGEGV